MRHARALRACSVDARRDDAFSPQNMPSCPLRPPLAAANARDGSGVSSSADATRPPTVTLYTPASRPRIASSAPSRQCPLTRVLSAVARHRHAPQSTRQDRTRASSIIPHTRVGDSGSSRGSTPKLCSASATAFAITPPTETIPPSPPPFTPSGLFGDG